MIHEYQVQPPEFHESNSRNVIGVDPTGPIDLHTHGLDSMADFDHELHMGEPPRPNPKRVTGVHRDIRTTQIDEGVILPPPFYDEPVEDVPGEQENASGDRPEEITEDAYDE